MENTIQTRAARYGTPLGRPSETDLAAYEAKLAAMDDAVFTEECSDAIFWSSTAFSNPRDKSHWMVDACYADAKRRGGEDAPLYEKAYKQVAREQGIEP